jgi:hypothetical protein
MQPHRAALSASFVLSFLLAGAQLDAIASPSGLAWDSVTKIAMNADPATLAPGSFDSDFAAAAAVQQPEQSGGGIFKQIKQAMNEGQSMQQMMQTGMAEHHYVAGSKDRTDRLFSQTATIVDCAARTITTLDLRRKTYKVVSMDQPTSGGSGGTSSSHGGASDNDTHVAISVTNTALGARNVGGQATDGYRSQMTITETSSSGQSQTQNGNLLAWYSSFANPAPTCSGGSPIAGGRAAAAMAGYLSAMRALSSAGGDSRFTVTQSGPRLPLGRLAMYDAMTLRMQGQAASFVTERGNVRTIDTNDPIFSVPEGFTQEQ